MNISELKIGDFIKKKNCSIEEKIIEIGIEWQSGYNYVILYNDVTGFKHKLINLNNYEKSI
jgi:hypothetical protein